jgi:hypothetical protein
MIYPDLEAARRHHAALKALFGEPGRIERRRTVRKVEALCRAASCAIDDADCRETLGIVGDSRLSSMEVIRRAGAQVANQGER